MFKNHQKTSSQTPLTCLRISRKVFTEKLDVGEMLKKLTFVLVLWMYFEPWAPQALRWGVSKFSNERSSLLRTPKELTFKLDLSVYSEPWACQTLRWGVSKFWNRSPSLLEKELTFKTQICQTLWIKNRRYKIDWGSKIVSLTFDSGPPLTFTPLFYATI